MIFYWNMENHVIPSVLKVIWLGSVSLCIYITYILNNTYYD